VTLPDSLTTIGAYAFYETNRIAKLVLPDSVTTIGNYAWCNSIGLRNIYLNENLKKLPPYAFSGCAGLVSVVLTDGLETISDYAFSNCPNLSAISIPDSVTSISSNAFSGCPKLTIYCNSATAAHYMAEQNNLRFELLDEHEHVFRTDLDIAAECTRGGSQLMTCTECGYNYIELTDPLGHDYSGEYVLEKEEDCVNDGSMYKVCLRCQEKVSFITIDALGHDFSEEITVDIEANCVDAGSQSRHCLRCDEKTDVTQIPAMGHAMSEWTVEKAATILQDGLRLRKCSVCGFAEEEILPKIEIDPDETEKYGVANFKVVNATTLEPIKGASLFIATENDGECTITTDANGCVSQVLPVGRQVVSAWADGCRVRNLRVNITAGECDIPAIGLSESELVEGKLTAELMTYDEILAAGIDVSNPANKHVYKYKVTLEFDAGIDVLNMFFCVNLDGDCLVRTIVPEDEEETSQGQNNKWKCGPIIGPGYDLGWMFSWLEFEKDNGETVKVYPVSERFFLIIYGEVRWLKEMFDVELLVMNHSLTDTLEDCEATLSLPEGLSLAAMTGDDQTLSQHIGTVPSGKSKSVHWYVRGDKEGSYSLNARLKGVLQPFGEEIDNTYTTEESIKVYAGSAMRLTYYVPDAAYYGKQYTFRAELENVSDRTLYNVSHLITGLKQCKITHYSDGKVEETVYSNEGNVASDFAKYFRPGDKLVLEVSTTIQFESEIIQDQKDRLQTAVYIGKGLMETYEQLNAAYEIASDLGDFTGALTSFVTDGLLNLDTFQNGSKVLKMLKYMDAGKNVDPDDVAEGFDWAESLCNVIQSVPVRFQLINSMVETLEGSTTEIPTRIVPIHEAGEQWVVNPAKYLHHLVVAMFGENAEGPELFDGDFYTGSFVNIKEAMGYENSVKYLKAVDQQVQAINVFTAEPNTTCKAWSERGTLKLSTKNDSLVSDGVLNFAGNAVLEVTPTAEDDTLYVDIGNGVIRTFEFDSYEAHTCSASEWSAIVYPTDSTDGFEIAYCDVCREALDVRTTTACDNHEFGEFEVDAVAENGMLGVNSRICEHCHYLDWQIVNELGQEQIIIEFDANGGNGDMSSIAMMSGDEYTLPGNAFTNDGMQFVCWNTQPDGTGIYYTDGETVRFADNTVLYAQWSEDGKLDINMDDVIWSDKQFAYDGTQKQVTLSGLPYGVEVIGYSGHTAVEIGRYSASATFSYNEELFNAPVVPEWSWSIEKAISFREDLDRVYSGAAMADADMYTLIVDETPEITFYKKDADGNYGKIENRPVEAGEYLVTASVSFGEPVFTQTDERKFTILKRPLTITALDTECIYDGQEQGAGGVSAEGLVAGHAVRNLAIVGGAANVGTYENILEPVRAGVFDDYGRMMTQNYEITFRTGSLTILPREVLITAEDAVFDYDGQPHTGVGVTAQGLADGHVATGFTFDFEQTEIGVYEDQLIPANGIIADAQGNDVSSNYVITTAPGTLEIRQVFAETILLSAQFVAAEKGDVFVIDVEVLPENTTVKDVVWKSSNTKVAKVNAEGRVSILKGGKVEIKVTAADGGGAAATCVVNTAALKTMKLPAAISWVETESFIDNKAMEAVDLSANKKVTIEPYSFANCTALKKVVLPEVPTISPRAFDNCPQVVLFCKNEAAKLYAQTWNLQYIMMQ